MQQQKSRQKSKTRAWEKERRDRINESLKKLSLVLPCYDPSKTLSKIDILDGATAAIKDLEEKVKNLLAPPVNEKAAPQDDLKVNIIKKLQERVKKLLTRNEQLTNLLKTAGITIPTECSTIKKFTRRYKDKYKIPVDKLAHIQKELEKENQTKNFKAKKPRTKTKPSIKNKKCSKKDNRRSKVLTSSNCIFLVPQTGLINNSCYIIAKTPKKTNQTVITSSLLLKTPIVSSNVKPSIFAASNTTTTNIDPMTLVMANGTLMPTVLPPPTPIIPPIITNPIQSTLIVVSSGNKTIPTSKMTIVNPSIISNTVVSKSKGGITVQSTMSTSDISFSNIRPVLRPKTCATRTTHVNKVPIPALTSRHITHSCISSAKNRTDTANDGKGKIEEKKNKTKKSHDLSSSGAKKSKNDNSQDVHDLIDKSQRTDADRMDSEGKDVMVSKDSVEIKKVVPENKDSTETIGKNILILENSVTLASNDTITQKMVESSTESGTKNNSSIVEIAGLEEILTQKVIISQPEPKITNTQTSVKSSNLPAPSKILKDIPAETTCSTCTTCTVITSTTELSSSIATVQSDLKSFNENGKPLPTVHSDHLKSIDINLGNTEFSNDLFASLQVPTGCQNPESTSPTAAFLLAFPLVSSGVKVTEVIGDDNAESQQAATPNLLQIGTMDSSKPTQSSHSDSLTPGLLGLDNFSFFGSTTANSKDNCGGFYNGFNGPQNNANITSLMAPTAVPFPAVDIQLPQLGNKDNVIDQSKTQSNKTSKKSDTENFSCRNNNYGMLNDKATNNLSMSKDKIKSHSISNQNLLNSNSIDINGMHSATDLFQVKSATSANVHHYETKPKNNQMLLPQTSSSMLSASTALPPVNRTFHNCSSYLNYKEPTANSSYTITNGGSGSNNYFYNSYSAESITDNSRNYNYNNFSGDYRKPDNFLPQYNEPLLSYNKDKFTHHATNSNIVKSSAQNKPINWMTAPSTTTSYKSDYFLQSFAKDNDFNSAIISNSYFGTDQQHDGKKSSMDVTHAPASQYGTTIATSSNSSIYNQRTLSTTATATTITTTTTDMVEEINQFSWSPNKMPQFLDPPAFVASTLPMLVGDLALNSIPVIEQKPTKDGGRQRETKKIFDNNSSNFLSVSQLVEQQHNRDSVPAKVSSIRRSSGNRSKHNTGGTSTKSKRSNNSNNNNNNSKAEVNMFQKANDKSPKHFGNLFCDNTKQQQQQQQMTHRNNTNKMSYSAEALIGNQLTNDISTKKTAQNRPIVSSFLSDNIMPYFPTTIDVPPSQDNGYMQSNQGYHHPHHHHHHQPQSNSFSHNFTTFQSGNSYSSTNNILPPPSACAISSTYLPTNNNFSMHNNQEFEADNTQLFHTNNIAQMNKEKSNYGKSNGNNYHHHNHYHQAHRQSSDSKEDKTSENNNNNNSSTCKKAKKRNYTDSALPPFDIPFLSLSGTINSPILPDDFHTTYLPPTTLYSSCKNTLYSKSASDLGATALHGIPPPPPPLPSTTTLPTAMVGGKTGAATGLIQHPEISPSVVNSVGTSLANFNLSTIFPEINKGPIQDSFPDMRNKGYSISRSFPPPTSSIQMPFTTGKPPISFGSFGT